MTALIAPLAENDPHGVLSSGLRAYRAAFEKTGRRTMVFEAAKIDRAAVDMLRGPKIERIFSDGGWINSIRVAAAGGSTSLADVANKPTIVLVNDNPCSHWMDKVLDRDRPNQTTCFLDPDFSTLWGRWEPQVGMRQAYVPAAFDLGPPPADEERTIDRLVVVGVREPEFYRRWVMEWVRSPSLIKVFEAVIETASAAVGPRPFSAACDEACRSLGVRLNYRAHDVRLTLFAADYYVRNRRRQIMLDRLSAYPITLAGGGTGFRLHPDSRVLPPMAYGDILALYRRARVVVVSPPYAGGISERTTQAAAAGALVVSPPTLLADMAFGRDRLYVAAANDFADLDACLDRAADPTVRRTMTRAALDCVRKRFSPEAAVRRFMNDPEAAPLWEPAI